LKEFHKKALSQISIWAWAATILPLVALAGLFFLEMIGLRSYYHATLIVGATVMFAVSVVWWWWALYTIAGVTSLLGKTSEKLDTVVEEVTDIKKEFIEIKKDT
jgi:hypothetical protein